MNIGKFIGGTRRTLSSFSYKHIGINPNDLPIMLKKCNSENLNDLIDSVNPNANNLPYNIPEISSQSEYDASSTLKHILSKNKQSKSFIGMGYYNTYTPYPIKRHVLENPLWYTAYTPYQSEISQGRLESQYNYQIVVKELTGLQLANSSLLDEASCASEVINMCHGFYKTKRKTFICSKTLHPQTLHVIETRCKILGVNLKILDLSDVSHITNKDINLQDVFGIMFQYPDTYGNISIPKETIDLAKENNILTSCATDLMALTKLICPGDLGIDISFGNSQRFGIPMWFGGPHPAFLSADQKLIRLMPGRIIGQSKDTLGDIGFRIALQTREQHIRREKATSNICTAQSLLTNVVSMFSMYHGKEGLLSISKNIHDNAINLANVINSEHLLSNNFFDTLCFETNNTPKIYEDLLNENILLRYIDDTHLGISLDETTTAKDIEIISDVYQKYEGHHNNNIMLNECFQRTSDFMPQSIFHKYTSETNISRYIHKLAAKDYTLEQGMIPLGSCTMKLNSVSQLEPLSWPEVCSSHPYMPKDFVEGYHELIDIVGKYLKDITGYNHVSFQSNSGAVGEYTGLLCIKKHFETLGEKRNICLIPNSAHGTNFASASIANMKIVKFDDNIMSNNFDDFVAKYKDNLACLMITYPNTNGVFQEDIKHICDTIHKYGGMVYMDGANMNAIVGINSPAHCGADVCHLNLHKTFCIPHGGGGPGMGPILCNDTLAPYLPINAIQQDENDKKYKDTIGAITSSNYSSAVLLAIPYMYISTMGSESLKYASQIAILNSNYLKFSLQDYYTIRDVNTKNYVGHEFIIDVSEFKKYGINENDIAKRLLDYSFHPPTMSWPRQGVLMFEPTESESKEELDRLIEAMISIRSEIDEIIDGTYQSDNNVLKNAPHHIKMIENWIHPYNQSKAFYPVENLKTYKFWPKTSRIDDLYGDKMVLKS